MPVTPRINTAIGTQKFEFIRDRIGEILTAEFTEQATLQTDPDIVTALQGTTFFRERFTPFNESEFIATSIFFFSGIYSSQNPTYARGQYTFYIDMYGSAEATDINAGDELSSVTLQTIAGFMRSILESPQWIRLGFEKDNPEGVVIENSEVISLKRTEESNNRDTGNIMMYRLIFQVTTGENATADIPQPILGSDIEVSIEETDLGYQYIYNE